VGVFVYLRAYTFVRVRVCGCVGVCACIHTGRREGSICLGAAWAVQFVFWRMVGCVYGRKRGMSWFEDARFEDESVVFIQKHIYICVYIHTYM